MKTRYLLFMGFGFELTGLIIGGLYVGGLYDEANGTQGIGRAIGAFTGLIVWCFHLYQASKRLEKDEADQS